MTQIADISDRLRRLAKRREDEGIYTDASLCSEAAAAIEFLNSSPTAQTGEAVAITRTDILREWFGGDRYARDYEYLNVNFGAQADRVVAFLSHLAPAVPDAVEEMRQTASVLRKNANGDCNAIQQAIYWEQKAAALAASHMPVGDGDYFSLLVERARQAAEKASAKFPQPNYIALKIAEEAGEVVRGAVHYAENRMEWIEVEGEIVQLLAMLIRFVTEGDLVNGIVPPLAASTGEAGR